MKDFVIYLNAGHGNYDPKTKTYHTFKEDGKYYIFKNALGDIEHEAYEGQTNRLFADMLAKELEKLEIKVVKTYDPMYDLANFTRIGIANAEFTKGKAKSPKLQGLWVSFHSNAFSQSFEGQGTEAQGIEFWTTKGQTKSDTFAQIWYNNMQKVAKDYGLKMRADFSDGDADKEENFYELFGTLMPAVLIENLFFTNLREAKLLHNPNYQIDVVQATTNAILEYAKIVIK